MRTILLHLRFPFSLNLLPVFGFAMAHAPLTDPFGAGVLFVLLHLLVYPSSNGYNSHMDRDEGSIGGIEHPPPVPAAMAQVTLAMDGAALAAAAVFLPPVVAALMAAYVVFSRLYSHRAIRLKRHPIAGTLTVALFQGPAVYAMAVLAATGGVLPADGSLGSGLAVSFLLILAGYPLTQVYQHEQDAKDGVRTLSRLLGVKGTFLFSAGIFGLLTIALGWHGFRHGQGVWELAVLAAGLLPVGAVFAEWTWRVFRDPAEADFRSTMRLNRVAALCLNTVFALLLAARLV